MNNILKKSILIMSSIAITITLLMSYIIFQDTIENNRKNLSRQARTFAKIFESIARNNAYFRPDYEYPEDVTTTVNQIKESLNKLTGIGKTGEIVLGKKVKDEIVFYLPIRDSSEIPTPVKWKDSEKATPMRLALNGGHGTIKGYDYQGHKVIAAYEYLPFLEMGLVKKIHYNEFMLPLFKAILISLFFSIGAITIGVFFHKKMLLPLMVQIEDSKNEAIEANKAKGQFLANMSHEIKTPLNAILGFSDILAHKLTDEKHRKFATSIHISGHTLLELINDILDLSKIDSGKFSIEFTEMNPKRAILEVLDQFDLEMEKKNLQFKVDISNDLPEMIFFDELRLQQMLSNLISNAIKFTDKGNIEVSVKFFNLNGSNSFKVSVRDYGIGISETNQKRIFNEFEQVEGQSFRKFGGTGLGLSICNSLSKLLNGEISLESVEGEGTTFTLIFSGIEVINS